jgi:hypothetical protein
VNALEKIAAAASRIMRDAEGIRNSEREKAIKESAIAIRVEVTRLQEALAAAAPKAAPRLKLIHGD